VNSPNLNPIFQNVTLRVTQQLPEYNTISYNKNVKGIHELRIHIRFSAV